MRLINVRTLQLEEFVNARTAGIEYAILSHTWEDEEVTYQEFVSGECVHKKGFSKIKQTCRRARKDGLSYAWVDSCCIDKESSAELTMSINSMWRWYREAAICYTFLSDMSGTCPMLLDVLEPDDELAPYNGYEDFDPGNPWHQGLNRCRWFNRGFTLQELVASEQLLFFNADWRLVGTKQSLVLTLSSITKIDCLVLQHPEALSLCTIAKKMSWASNRQTKYIEDRAYSLMGMFNVNMPLLYGEGDRAFVRLQEEIIKKSTDQSIFAWAPRSPGRMPVTDDLLFASSPDCFRDCGNVIHYQEARVDSHFQLTNRGAIFDKLYISKSGDGMFALLNCRLEDDLRGPLALRICASDDESSRFERNRILRNNEFWIGLGRENWEIETSSQLNSWIVHDRLIVYPSGGLPHSTFSDSQATLLRTPPARMSLPRDLPGPVTKYPPVWLRYDGPGNDQSLPFRLSEPFPNRFWNQRTHTMTVPEYAGAPKIVTATARVWLAEEDMPIYVAVKLSCERGQTFGDTLPVGLTFQVQLSRHSAEDGMQGLEPGLQRMKTTLSLRGGRYVRARTRLEQHLGEPVLVVRLSLRDADQDASQPPALTIYKNYPGGGYSAGDTFRLEERMRMSRRDSKKEKWQEDRHGR